MQNFTCETSFHHFAQLYLRFVGKFAQTTPSFRFALCLFYSIYASLASSSWNNSPEVFHPNISLG